MHLERHGILLFWLWQCFACSNARDINSPRSLATESDTSPIATYAAKIRSYRLLQGRLEVKLPPESCSDFTLKRFGDSRPGLIQLEIEASRFCETSHADQTIGLDLPREVHSGEAVVLVNSVIR